MRNLYTFDINPAFDKPFRLDLVHKEEHTVKQLGEIGIGAFQHSAGKLGQKKKLVESILIADFGFRLPKEEEKKQEKQGVFIEV